MTPAPLLPPSKKNNVLLWILAGVGGFFLLIAIIVVAGGLFLVHKAKQAGLDPEMIQHNPALAATKMMTATNPDIEFVSVDENRQQIVLREKKTGKTYTISYDDAKKGRFKMESSDGTVQIGGDAKVPTWVPDYPGSNPQVAYSARGKDGQSGTFNFKTKDSSQQVAKYYREQLEAAGLVIAATINSGNGQVITAQDNAKERTVTLVIGDDGGETAVNITYANGK
jgi:hypothetical protein